MHQAGAADVREQLQASLLDMLDDGVVGTDADFCITHWNPGAERLYGHSASEVLGTPAKQVATFTGDNQRDHLERELLEHGRSRAEITAVRRDGTPIEVEIVVTAMRDAGARCAATSASIATSPGAAARPAASSSCRPSSATPALHRIRGSRRAHGLRQRR
jgi:PAS domain S-box-containing protein